MKYLQIVFPNKLYILIIALLFLAWRPFILQSETLKMYTYYPAPYAGYDKLLTTGNTYLAKNGSSSVYWGSGTSRLSNDQGGSIYLVGTSATSSPYIQFTAGANSNKLYLKSNSSVLAVSGDLYVEGIIRDICRLQSYTDGTNSYCGGSVEESKKYVIVSEGQMSTVGAGPNQSAHILAPSGKMVCCRFELTK